jgi:hypothetical protein
MDDPNVRDAANFTAFRMQEAYRWVRLVVSDLTDEQLRWQPNATTPSIRFHLFHIARWADRLHQLLTGADRQVWHAEEIARQWGLANADLGFGESGAMIDDEVAMALGLPERERLLAYCNRVLTAADEALADVGDEQMTRLAIDFRGQPFPIGDGIADQLSHTARHLGMIECLRGVQGLRGSATV